jgi:hypothetical protein
MSPKAGLIFWGLAVIGYGLVSRHTLFTMSFVEAVWHWSRLHELNIEPPELFSRSRCAENFALPRLVPAVLEHGVEEEGDIRRPEAQQEGLYRTIDRSFLFPHGCDGLILHLFFHALTGRRSEHALDLRPDGKNSSTMVHVFRDRGVACLAGAPDAYNSPSTRLQGVIAPASAGLSRHARITVLFTRNRTHFSNPTIKKAARPTPTTRNHSAVPNGAV